MKPYRVKPHPKKDFVTPSTKPIPEKFIPIRMAAKQLGITPDYMRTLIKKHGIDVWKIRTHFADYTGSWVLNAHDFEKFAANYTRYARQKD